MKRLLVTTLVALALAPTLSGCVTSDGLQDGFVFAVSEDGKTATVRDMSNRAYSARVAISGVTTGAAVAVEEQDGVMVIVGKKNVTPQ